MTEQNKMSIVVPKLKQRKTTQYYTLTKPSSFASVSLTPPLVRQNSQTRNTTTLKSKVLTKKRKDSNKA